MRSPWLIAPILAGLLGVAPASAAQGGKSAAPAKGSTSASAGSNEVRRDPKGIKGISPFWEALKKGDDAYVARDFDGAIKAYRDAITKEPRNPLGHYRMGEAQLAKGNMKEAGSAWQNALRFVGNNFPLKAKILFVLADLSEREKAYDDAIAGWNKYLALAKEHPEAKAFPESAQDRIKRINEWKKLVEEYAAVKKRIAQHLKEAEAKAKKNAR